MSAFRRFAWFLHDRVMSQPGTLDTWRGRPMAASLQNRTTTPMALLTDTVEKRDCGGGAACPVRKGFLYHRLGCNYDSPTAGDRNWNSIRSHIISTKIAFFNSIGPMRTLDA